MLMSALQYKTTVYIVSTSVDTGDATYLDNYLVLCQPVFFKVFICCFVVYWWALSALHPSNNNYRNC